MCCDPITVDRGRNQFTIHLAAIPGGTAEHYSSLANREDGEAGSDDPAATGWAVRETRNRALVVFVLWMACGFGIRWVLGLIVRDNLDLT